MASSSITDLLKAAVTLVSCVAKHDIRSSRKIPEDIDSHKDHSSRPSPIIPDRHVYATPVGLWHMQPTDEQPTRDGRENLTSLCARLGLSVVL